MSVAVRPLREGLLALVLLATAGPAAAQLRAIELAVETDAEAVVLPASPVGTLVVIPCPGCRPLSFVAGARAAYFIGERAVGLEELRRHLAARRGTNLVVLYSRESRELTRVIAAAR